MACDQRRGDAGSPHFSTHVSSALCTFESTTRDITRFPLANKTDAPSSRCQLRTYANRSVQRSTPARSTPSTPTTLQHFRIPRFRMDADRLIAVDERGGLVDGDQIMAVCALDLAERDRLRGQDHVTVIQRTLPEQMPAGPFDTILCSELLYYWSRPLVGEGLARIEAELCYPLFVKPNGLGSSKGVNPAPDEDQLFLAMGVAAIITVAYAIPFVYALPLDRTIQKDSEIAVRTEVAVWAPAASRKTGEKPPVGTRRTYLVGLFRSNCDWSFTNAWTTTGCPPGVLPSGIWLVEGWKYPDMTPAAPNRFGSGIAILLRMMGKPPETGEFREPTTRRWCSLRHALAMR